MEQIKRILEALPRAKVHIVIGVPLEILRNFRRVEGDVHVGDILKYSYSELCSGMVTKGYLVRSIDFYKARCHQEEITYHQYEDLVSTKISRTFKAIRTMKCQSSKQ